MLGTERELKSNSFISLFRKNYECILPIFFYFTGIFIGSSFFNNLKNTFLIELFNDVFLISNTSFESLLINKFCVYFSIYALTVILGMCLIGFSFLNVIPLLIGLELGLKISYFYVLYGVKGIGYSLLMIIPEASALITIIILTISQCNILSKNIYSISVKKIDIAQDVNLKLYLKSFAFYSIIIALIAIINTTLFIFLGSIITI